jgi:competence protein ComEC
MVAAVVVCAAAGGVAGAVRVDAVRTGPVAVMAERHAQVKAELVVTGAVRPLAACPGTACRPRTLVPARLVRVRDDGGSAPGRPVRVRLPVLVIAGAEAAALAVGQPFTAYGRLSPPHPGELLAAVVLVRGRVTDVRRPPPPYSFAQTVRERLREQASALPQPARGLLPAIVVGDRTGVPQETNDQFLAAGMTHLLAVSGANLAILAAAIAGLARLLRRPVLAALAALPATALFVLVAGPEPSVLRAAVMGTIAAVALASGRERSGLRTLSVAVLALVLFDPELARSYAFALSTLATAGILVLGPRIADRLGARLPRWLATALAIPVAAELACAPVVAMMAAQVSVVAVPANLVADPLVAPATVLGALVAALAPVLPQAAAVLVWPAGCAVAGIALVARLAAAVPHATIPWPGGLVGAVSLLAAIVAGALLIRRLRRRHRALIVTAALTVLAVAIAFKVAAPGWPARHWLLTACDVGQGDGLALATGDGGAVVVDTGPRPDLMDSCLRRLSVTRVPLMVLTHFHADHAGGVDGVLSGRRVGAVAASPYHVPAESYDHVARALAARRIPLWTAVPGWRVRIGTADLTVLGPAPETAREASTEGDDAGPNDASVVLYARDGPLTALLTGDVEPPAQDALLASGVPHAQVLKVPHHGSANQDPAFLAAPGARAAIISVGRDNGYGHPSPRTVDRLRGLGTAVYRTDTDGDVQVAADGRGGLVTSIHRAAP